MTADCISWRRFTNNGLVYTDLWQSSSNWHPKAGFLWRPLISGLDRHWYDLSLSESIFVPLRFFCRESWCRLSIRSQLPQGHGQDTWRADCILERISDPYMELGGVALFPNALRSSNISTSQLHSHPTEGPATWECRFSLYVCPTQSKHFWIGASAEYS